MCSTFKGGFYEAIIAGSILHQHQLLSLSSKVELSVRMNVYILETIRVRAIKLMDIIS